MRKKTKWFDVVNEITSENVKELIMAQVVEKKSDEEWKKHVEESKSAPDKRGAIPNEITLSITLDKDGRISMKGPLHDKILCYGLLQYGRDIVSTWQPTASAPARKTKGAFGGVK